MEHKTSILSEGFKSLWEKDSPIYLEWGKFETLYWAIGEIAQNQAIKASAFRNPGEINQDIQAGKQETGELAYEAFFVLWNRFLLRSCLKIRDSLELMFYSINTTNAYGCTLTSRSVIEHVALVQYFVKKVPWHDSGFVESNIMLEFSKEFIKLTQGSTFDWDKILYSNLGLRALLASKSWKRPGNKRIPHITTLVDALDEELSPLQGRDAEGYLRFIYSALCDVVHPSWGGDFIYAPQIYRDMKSKREFDEHFKKITTLFCLPIIGVVHHYAKLVEFMINNEPRTVVIFKPE